MLQPGTRLGPYEILSAAGAGGMGEVYRARDTRLDRTVAVKILSSELGLHPDVLQRFEREARAVSSLNHPNICTLHDVGTADGTPYLVMEYVEGETLQERLSRGPLPLADMWRIAIQIGEALDQAHRRGIVHRDLKPGNVMLAGGKASTTVKLLDFGLAKVMEAPVAPGNKSSLPTVVQGLTVEGTIVGTFQYMAPEQLEGGEIDHRSDIFAFGCVLYEMVTGRKAFEGKSQATLISSIMTAEPPAIASFQPAAPAALDRLVRKCLAKNPDDRWQTARDLAGELRWIAEAGSQTGVAPTVIKRRGIRAKAAWILAGALAMALAAVLAIHLGEKPPEERAVRFLLPLPDKAFFRWFDTAALSPDGSRIAFSAGTDPTAGIFVRELKGLEAKRVSAADSGAFPFWSPDSLKLAFFADGKLKRIDLLGGPAVTICNAFNGFGGTWNRDGVILLAPNLVSPILRVDASGGTPVRVTQLDTATGQTGHQWPFFLPDGRHFLFTVASSRPETRGIYVGSLDSPQVSRISSEDSNAQFVAPGFLIFHRADSLFGQPFDTKRLQTTGEPFPLAEQVASFSNAVAGGSFSASASELVYRSGSRFTSSQLVWFDRKGARLGTLGQAADYSNPAISPDGRLVAIGKRDLTTRNRDIWLFDLARGTSMKLTFDPADDTNPVWSPDGQRVAFSSDRKGHRNLFLKAASGVGPEETVLEAGQDNSLEDWTRDGRYLIFNRLIAGKREIWALPLFGDRKPFALIGGPNMMVEGHVSPNGKWIAYTSSESGRPEVYVQNFPPAGGRWQVSTAGGRQPMWRQDGKELFYIQGEKLTAVDVRTEGGRFDAGIPKSLFEAPLGSLLRNSYVVTPDGQKFLVNTRIDTTNDALPMMMVLNWPAGIER